MTKQPFQPGSIRRVVRPAFLWVVSAALGISLLSTFHASPLPKEKNAVQNQNKQRIRKPTSLVINDTPFHWLAEEVPYIITDDKKAAFESLTTEDEREQFIASFWERRNPNPGSSENVYKDEYYRRIAFANQAFSSETKGWRTDRGRFYILHGPPDEIGVHPNAGSYVRPPEEGEGTEIIFPYEEWKYRCIDPIGKNVAVEFVGSSRIGEFHLVGDSSINALLLHASPVGPLLPGGGCDAPQPSGTTQTQPDPDGKSSQGAGGGHFVDATGPPAVKFKDLQAVILAPLGRNNLSFNVDTSFVPTTEKTVLVVVTIQVPRSHLQFQSKGGASVGLIDFYGQFSGPSGRFIAAFEKEMEIDLPAPGTPDHPRGHTTYQKVVPLRSGLYKLSLVLKDALSSKMGAIDLGVHVPGSYPNPTNSSLILADKVNLLSTTDGGEVPFVIGGARITPNLCREFTRGQEMGVFMAVQGLEPDPQTSKTSLTIRYAILRNDQTIMELPEDPEKLAHATVVYTIDKKIPLKSLEPGKYELRVNVTDNVTNRSISPSATFRVIQPNRP